MDENEIAAFGASVARRLVAAKASAAQPAVAVRTLVSAMLQHHATVKLPELLADEEVRHWLAARQISDGQLRHALTEARRGTRKTARVEAAVRRPRRLKPVAQTVVEAASAPSSNRPHGTVANGAIADL